MTEEPCILRLAGGTSTTDLAGACRTAWRSFASLSLRWGRGEVFSWTARSYAPLVSGSRRSALADDELVDADPRFVQRIVRTARSRLIETLWSFNAPDERVQFARDAYATGLVVRCRDGSERLGFAPATGQRTLSARVLSVVAADLLTRSLDFTNGALCGDCGNVKLGPEPCCFVAELRRVAT